MKIKCQAHYDMVVRYASSIKDSTLQACLDNLIYREKHSRLPCEIELYWDHAPYSFLFKQRYQNGSYGLIGGLVYHGTPDQSCCFQDDGFKGWRIHT